MQQRVTEWRDEVLQKPLVASSKSLSYPKEIEVRSPAVSVASGVPAGTGPSPYRTLPALVLRSQTSDCGRGPGDVTHCSVKP